MCDVEFATHVPARPASSSLRTRSHALGGYLDELVEQQRILEDALHGFDEAGAEVEDGRLLLHHLHLPREVVLDLPRLLVL